MTPKITKEAVFHILNDDGTHRKQFSANSGVQKNKSSPTFSVPFDSGLCEHFRNGTENWLQYGVDHNQYYCFLRNQTAISAAESWEACQGTRVFLKNTLTTSLALDFNFIDNTSGKKTKLGKAEEAAKHSQDENAIVSLTRLSAETIADIAYLKQADYICAVPATPEKRFDLPTRLARCISEKLGKPDLTPHFSVTGKDNSLRSCTLGEKWDVWSSTKIVYNGPNIEGKKIILIDDKYQSGVTLQYIGMVLQEHGASEIHGLCMVKTLRDTDNS